MRPNLTPPPEPTDAPGFLERGNRYSRNGVYDKAIADYTRALELDDALAEAYYHRGVSFYELGDYAQSIADLTSAIARNPAADVYYAQRAVSYLLSDQLELAEADQQRCDELRGGE